MVFPIKAFGDAHIDHGLRVHLYRCDQFRQGFVGAANRGQHLQCTDHTIACAVFVQTQNMPRTLATINPTAFFELFQYIAVADIGARKCNAEFFKGFF